MIKEKGVHTSYWKVERYERLDFIIFWHNYFAGNNLVYYDPFRNRVFQKTRERSITC